MSKKLHNDIYVSVDVETTGHVPGPYSMLSIGAVALVDGKPVSNFYVNIEELPKAKRQPSTMEFWAKYPERWKDTRVNPATPEEAMRDFADWIMDVPGFTNKNVVFAANPASYDAGYIWYYFNRFMSEADMEKVFTRFRVLDIRTVIADVFNCDYSQAGRHLLPANWSNGFSITHNALDDAREQASVLSHLLVARQETFEAAMSWLDKNA